MQLEQETTLRGLTKTDSLVTVAEFDPVQIRGRTVQRAGILNPHSGAFAVGDRIVVSLRWDVIPQVKAG